MRVEISHRYWWAIMKNDHHQCSVCGDRAWAFTYLLDEDDIAHTISGFCISHCHHCQDGDNV